jgi:hypothetical protein
MVLLAELAGDVRQRTVGELSGDVHRDMARRSQPLIATRIVHLFDRQPVGLGHPLFDERDRNADWALRYGVFQYFRRQLDRNRRARQRREGNDPDEPALEFADAKRDNFCNERGNFVGNRAFSVSAFLRRIASRVSRSGGWISVSSPHSKRERSRDSSV